MPIFNDWNEAESFLLTNSNQKLIDKLQYDVMIWFGQFKDNIRLSLTNEILNVFTSNNFNNSNNIEIFEKTINLDIANINQECQCDSDSSVMIAMNNMLDLIEKYENKIADLETKIVLLQSKK